MQKSLASPWDWPLGQPRRFFAQQYGKIFTLVYDQRLGSGRIHKFLKSKEGTHGDVTEILHFSKPICGAEIWEFSNKRALFEVLEQFCYHLGKMDRVFGFNGLHCKLAKIKQCFVNNWYHYYLYFFFFILSFFIYINIFFLLLPFLFFIFSTTDLKCHYDENRIFSTKAIFKHKQIACMRRKMPFTIFKYLFLFQRY